MRANPIVQVAAGETAMMINKVVFFDIGNTLGAVRLSENGKSIEEINPFPGVINALEELRAENARLGILSDPSAISEKEVIEALDKADLLQFLDPTLILFGNKDTPLLFRKAAEIAAQNGHETNGGESMLLFVGENEFERQNALVAGFLTASSPQLALSLLTDN